MSNRKRHSSDYTGAWGEGFLGRGVPFKFQPGRPASPPANDVLGASNPSSPSSLITTRPVSPYSPVVRRNFPLSLRVAPASLDASQLISTLLDHTSEEGGTQAQGCGVSFSLLVRAIAHPLALTN
jgi:hypothetical protein